MEALFGLTGKVALVTGAASGIGKETATLLHALGATLIATDRVKDGVAATAASLAPEVLALPHDVTSEEDWAEVFERIRRDYGRLDILVNNAGIMMSEPFTEAPIESLRRQQRVNVESIYIGMQGAIPLMRTAIAAGATSASIINISSVYGKVAGAQFAAYSATKGAVLALSRAVAFELAATGIRVNAVLPGPIATNLAADWEPPRDASGNPLPLDEALAAWAKLIPMGRVGTTSEIAPLIAFLASDAARFITGAEFIADGGYTAA